MRPDVCAIEWDGDLHIAVKIDIYVFVWLVESFEPRTLVLYRSYQHWQDGWCRPGSMNFEPRPDLVRLAERRVLDIWAMHEQHWGVTIDQQPAQRLFYDPDQEVFDRRRDVAKLLGDIIMACDLDTHLKRRPA